MSLGTGELLILAFVLLVVFSASRMGALGNALGKFVYSFKKAAKGQDFVDVKSKRVGGGGERPSSISDGVIVEDAKKSGRKDR